MTRPLRIEFPGALYHVTSRGDRRRAIFFQDEDRRKWLEILELVCKRFNVVVHAYCQMGNHFHLMPETLEGNLTQAMRQLNSIYAQYFNRRYGLVGHVFQGRYKAILVQRESYLLELARYIVLNPVRGGQVAKVDDWPWSSYPSTVGDCECPSWQCNQWLLDQFGPGPDAARQAFRQFVLEGARLNSPLLETKHQFILGDDAFAERYGELIDSENCEAISRVQRRSAVKSLTEYQKTSSTRDDAMARAYLSTGYTMRQIGKFFGVHPETVSRAVKRAATGKT